MGLAHSVRDRSPPSCEAPAGTEAYQAARKADKRDSSLRRRYAIRAKSCSRFTPTPPTCRRYLKCRVGLTDDQTTIVALGSLIFATSDRIGRKWLLIGFGVGGVPFTQAVKGPFAAFLLIAAAWMIFSGYTSINAVVKAEPFPASIRDTRVPYAITVSSFGRTADSIALWFQ
jgi:MFS transporter, MHS family, alpha-ketoglutarate permease